MEVDDDTVLLPKCWPRAANEPPSWISGITLTCVRKSSEDRNIRRLGVFLKPSKYCLRHQSGNNLL